MHPHIVPLENLSELVTLLTEKHDVFGPVRGPDGAVRFQKIVHAPDVEWNYTGSLLPPKKYFLPVTKILYKFKYGRRSPKL